MKQFETEHYVFNYPSGSKAEQDIQSIAARQEACVCYMCSVLGIQPKHKLQYFLLNTAQEVALLYNGEPCTGLAIYPDKIYATYNDHIQCVGFHEDAHILSFMWADPNPYNPALEEGFAMYFDRRWRGIHNLDWAGYFLKCGKYIPIDRLLEEETFLGTNDFVTYPLMGAFTQWLIERGGMERYHSLYEKRDQKSAMLEVYGKTAEEMNRAFTQYLGLFKTDAVLEQRMAQLLKENGC